MGELLVTVSIAIAFLSLITGCLVMAGARKTNPFLGFFLFLFMLGASVWSISCCITTKIETFDRMSPSAVLDWIILCGSVVALIAFFSYNMFEYKFGRLMMTIFILWGLSLMIAPAFDLSLVGNLFEKEFTWYKLAYVIFVPILTLSSFVTIWYRHKYPSIKNKYNKSSTVFTISVIIVCLTAVVFSFVLPSMGNRSLAWVAPLMSSIIPICFLYAALRQHELSLPASFLVSISYVIFLGFTMIIYLATAMLLDILMFGGENGYRYNIFVYSILISVVLLVLVKIFLTATEFLRSMVTTSRIDLAYVIGRIQRHESRSDLARLAKFLSEHLHVDYVGFIRDNRLYESDKIGMSQEEIQRIIALNNNSHEMWQAVDLNTSYMLSSFGVKRVASVTDYTGQQLCQIMLGRPTTKDDFSYKDLRDISIVLSEVGVTLSDKKEL